MSTSNKVYKLIIFDLDGTLTPARASSDAPFEQRLLPNVQKKFSQAKGSKVVIIDQRRTKHQTDALAALHDHLEWLGEVLPSLWGIWIAQEEWALKPSPAMVYAVMVDVAKWRGGLEASQVLMVGDSTTDQEAAIAAGVDFQWAKDFFGWKRNEQPT